MKAGRIEKINSELQQEIANIIHNELKDPRIDGFISLIKVETDNDLYMTNVYVSIYNSKNKEKTFEALNSSSGYIRKLLSSRIRLRTIPIINFKLDKSIEYSETINKILENIDIPEEE